MRLYEGMFIIDNTIASSDWDAATKQVHSILENKGSEIIRSENWGERKLAYKIKGQKRGTYLLTYFNAPQESITSIKRDLQLSDNILRSLIVKIEKIKEPAPTEEEKTEEVPVPVVSE